MHPHLKRIKGLLNAHEADEIQEEIDAGNSSAVFEMLEREALIHDSCMSPGRAEEIRKTLDAIALSM